MEKLNISLIGESTPKFWTLPPPPQFNTGSHAKPNNHSNFKDSKARLRTLSQLGPRRDGFVSWPWRSLRACGDFPVLIARLRLKATELAPARPSYYFPAETAKDLASKPIKTQAKGWWQTSSGTNMASNFLQSTMLRFLLIHSDNSLFKCWFLSPTPMGMQSPGYKETWYKLLKTWFSFPVCEGLMFDASSQKCNMLFKIWPPNHHLPDYRPWWHTLSSQNKCQDHLDGQVIPWIPYW